jgi:hypothetical protein
VAILKCKNTRNEQASQQRNCTALTTTSRPLVHEKGPLRCAELSYAGLG